MIPVRGFEGKTVAVFGLARTGLASGAASSAEMVWFMPLACGVDGGPGHACFLSCG